MSNINNYVNDSITLLAKRIAWCLGHKLDCLFRTSYVLANLIVWLCSWERFTCYSHIAQTGNDNRYIWSMTTSGHARLIPWVADFSCPPFFAVDQLKIQNSNQIMTIIFLSARLMVKKNPIYLIPYMLTDCTKNWIVTNQPS